MRKIRLGWSAAAIVGIAAGSLLAPTAHAALIVDQQPTADIGLPSSFYTLTPAVSVAEIDSFTTAVAYNLGVFTAFPSSDGIGAPISVTASIYSGGPPGGPGAELVTTAFGTLTENSDIVVDFDGALLPAGSYYITAFVLRQTPNDGIWYWNTTYSGPTGADLEDRSGGAAGSRGQSVYRSAARAGLYVDRRAGDGSGPCPEPPTALLLSGGMAFALFSPGADVPRWRRPLHAAEGFSGVRSDFHLRPQWHDSGRIDAPMAFVIVMLDMEEIDRLGDARQVVELA